MVWLHCFLVEFLCQSSHIPYRSVSQCILLSRSLNRSVPAITIIIEYVTRSIPSSLGAAHAKQRPPLSDIKTWRIGGRGGRPTRHRTTSSSKQLGTAAEQRTDRATKLKRAVLSLSNDHVGSWWINLTLFRWPRGAADYIIIIEASNLDEGQRWNTSH